jgi:SAM-dependent methyltransferase
MERKHCPLCNSGASYHLVNLQDFEIVKCSICGFVYVRNPRADTSSGFKFNVDINKPHIRHMQIVQLIGGCFDNINDLDVVEIGSGYGHLAHLVKKGLPRANYTGFELSKQRAAFCLDNKINVINGPFVSQTESCDVVVMDNVLEHILDPMGLLYAAENSLRKGGIVIIIVPNRNDLRRFYPAWRKRHYWQPGCHINYFSFSDVLYMASKTGLTLRNFSSSSLPSHGSIFLKIKTLLDNVGLHIGGLYLYAAKN